MDQVEQDTADHDAFLCSYLAERDEECPMCSYNLRGLTGQVCPECGEALRMRVSLCEPKMGLYLAGVIGWAVGAGFAGLLLSWILYLWVSGNYGPGMREVWPLFFQFIAQGSMLVWSLWKGRWIRKRETIVRRALAASAWILSFVFSIAFFTLAGP